MAVAIATVDPADGDLKVVRDYPVTVELTDSSDLDPDLVEVIVNGVSHTVANGGLEYWQTTKIAGGAVVPDLTDVFFGTLLPWWAYGGGEVEVTVEYDGSTIGTQEWCTDEAEGPPFGPLSQSMALAIGADASFFAPDIQAEVISLYYPSSHNLQALVTEVSRRSAADVRTYVGTRYIDYVVGSAVVGHLEISYHVGSGVLEGWKLDYSAGSGITQGWRLDYGHGSGVVGVVFTFYGRGSGIVGLEHLEYSVGSGIVRGLNRDNALEIEIIDAATYAKLAAAGVVFA